MLWVADVAVVVGLLMYWRFRVSYAGVSSTEFFKRGWLPGIVRLPRDAVATVLVARTYRGASTETLPQLIALGHDGEVLFRMRGGYWPDEAITAVTDALGSAVTTVSPADVGRRVLPHLAREPLVVRGPPVAQHHAGRGRLRRRDGPARARLRQAFTG